MVSGQRFFIRVDSSGTLGFGHLYRCLTLANALREHGAHVEFISLPLAGNGHQLIIANKFKLHLLSGQEFDIQADWQATRDCLKKAQADSAWLIVDHYAIDYRWQLPLSKLGIKLFVIDDLAERSQYCDYLLNPTFNIKASAYQNLLNSQAKCLLGEKYIILRPEFLSYRQIAKKPINLINPKVHVFFGSTDLPDHCYNFCLLLLKYFPNFYLKVVTCHATTAKWQELLACYNQRLDICAQAENMAASMHECDFALGAPGTATWERAALGLPAVYLAVHPNQITILTSLAQQGFCYYLGEAATITAATFIEGVAAALDNPTKLQSMAKIGAAKIDGLGVNRLLAVLGEEK